MISRIRKLFIISVMSCNAVLAGNIPEQVHGTRIEIMLSPDEKIAFRWVAPGTFLMGSPLEEAGRIENESQVSIEITQGFYLAETELTQEQWLLFETNNPSHYRGKRLPVESITWDMAAEFCSKVNKKQSSAGTLPPGFRCDLPTEAQWEYACRAGCSKSLNNDATLSTPDGKCPQLDEVAWYAANANGKTQPVAGKRPNEWGLYDMHGNVWEWCRDTYVPTHSGGKDRCITSGDLHVRRGGSAGYPARTCRSASRDGLEPQAKGNGLGLRLALVRTDA